MKTRNYPGFLPIFICFMVTACFSPLDYQGGDAGTSISIILPGGSELPRTLVDPQELRYELDFSGPEGRTESKAAAYGETVTVKVVPGLWNISVRAVNSDGNTEAIGEQSVTVAAGINSTVPVKMIVYTEVDTWAKLKSAVEEGTYDEFIVIKNSSGWTGSLVTASAGNTSIEINNNRTVTIAAEEEGIIISSDPSDNQAFFRIYKGHLVLGSTNPKYNKDITFDGMETGGYFAEIWSEDSLFTMNTGIVKEFVIGIDIIDGTFTMNGGSFIDNSDVGVTADFAGGWPEFIMNDGYIGRNGNGVEVAVVGKFTMNGGTISGNLNIGVGNWGGQFTLNGGTISGNAGNGVNNSGNFTMSGSALITENKAQYGAGVYNDCEGTFTMNGGTISKNMATPVAGEGGGGGVYNMGTFTMTDGTIIGNLSMLDGGGVYYAVGDFSVKESEFSMTGGTISENTARQNGSGVYHGNIHSSMGGMTSTGSPLYISGSALININNDLFLVYADVDPSNGEYESALIKAVSPMLNDPMARITLEDYSAVDAAGLVIFDPVSAFFPFIISPNPNSGTNYNLNSQGRVIEGDGL